MWISCRSQIQTQQICKQLSRGVACLHTCRLWTALSFSTVCFSQISHLIPLSPCLLNSLIQGLLLSLSSQFRLSLTLILHRKEKSNPPCKDCSCVDNHIKLRNGSITVYDFLYQSWWLQQLPWHLGHRTCAIIGQGVVCIWCGMCVCVCFGHRYLVM